MEKNLLIKPQEKLLNLIKERSYFQGNFTLASGKKSQYYIDCRLTTLTADGAYLIGKIIFDMIKNLHIQSVGGLTLGADPIATAVSVVSYMEDQPIHTFIVRKEQKGHGQGKLIEGTLNPGDNVVVVEDVVTSGGSVLKAIQAIENAKAKIIKVICIIDRLEGGSEKLHSAGYTLESLFTINDLKK